jgi:hypothetical protein
MQNCAILRNALRKRNDELPSISNNTQSSETLRNSLVLNYESPALTAELQAQLPMKNSNALVARANAGNLVVLFDWLHSVKLSNSSSVRDT